jgi:hypothetical protein
MADPSNNEESRQIPIEWHIGDDIITRYATNMVVQHTEHEFIISFFEIKPLILLGPKDLERLESIDSVRAECIARVVVATERMPSFVKVLQTNLERALNKERVEQEQKQEQ